MRIPWNKYEVAILIDACEKINSNCIQIKDAVMLTSLRLRQFAKNRGIKIDNVFRNENGIRLRMEEMQCLLKNDLDSAFSKKVCKLYKEMYNVYKYNNEEYKKILAIAMKMTKSVDVCKIMMDNKELSCISNRGNSPQELIDVHKTEKERVLVDTSEHRLNTGTNQYYNDNEGLTYAEILKLSPEDYYNISTISLNLSKRLFKRLINAKLDNLGKILQVTEKTITDLNGIGKGSIKELHKVLNGLCSENKLNSRYFNDNVAILDGNTKKSDIIHKELLPFKDDIINGDFSFLNTDNIFNEVTKNYIKEIKEAYMIIDLDLIKEAINRNPQILYLIDELNYFSGKCEFLRKYENVISEIPRYRLEIKILNMIKYYSDDLERIDYLSSLVENKSDSVEKYLRNNIEKYRIHDNYFTNFLNWCKYDLHEEMANFLKFNIKNQRTKFVIIQRAKGVTLEEIGSQLGITRERVRQIENKIKIAFEAYQKVSRFSLKLFIEFGENIEIFSEEIRDYFGNCGEVVLYLMQNIELPNVTFSARLDMLIFDDIRLVELANSMVDDLPFSFSKEKLQTYIENAKKNRISERMFLAILDTKYEYRYNVYLPIKKNLQDIYMDIVKKYYPDGIYIYDQNEIEKFKKIAYEVYGLDIFDKTIHSIGSVVARRGLLCNKGIYRYYDKNEKLISDDLSKDIAYYIDNYSYPILMMNTIYGVFKEKLILENVRNKYYLQGILKVLYGDKWYFSRDYISKDKSCTSAVTNVVKYIKSSKYPVSKNEIFEQFPGVTDIVINFATNDKHILNLFGKYIHGDSLNISDSDKKYISDVIELFLSKENVCHCKKIYNYVLEDYPEIMTNNFVEYSFSFFSLMKYCFIDKYQFWRPYIARKNTVIRKGMDILKEIIKTKEVVSIEKIKLFIKENNLFVQSLIDLLDSCNGTHLLLNNNELASIEYIGITKEIINVVEEKICNEINKTTPISELSSISSLPRVNVEWNIWLIYSALKKWSTKLDVGLSNSQFKKAYPLVALKGDFDNTVSDKKYFNFGYNITTIDDIVNGESLDDLIEDISFDELDIDI